MINHNPNEDFELSFMAAYNMINHTTNGDLNLVLWWFESRAVQHA